MTPQQTDLLYLFNRFANQAKQYFEQDNSYKGGMYLGMMLNCLNGLQKTANEYYRKNRDLVELLTKEHLSLSLHHKKKTIHTDLLFQNILSLIKFSTQDKDDKESKNRKNFFTPRPINQVIEQLQKLQTGIDNFYHFKPMEQAPSPLPMAVRNLSISRYLGLQHMDTGLLPSTRFLVFTGNNGQGKTALLQAIVIALLEGEDEASGMRLSNKPVQVSCLVEGKSDLIAFRYQMSEQAPSDLNNNNSWLKGDPDIKSLCNNLFAYGASRLQLQSEESQDATPSRSNVYGLFKNNHVLLNIDHWFKIQKLRGEDKRIQAVIELLKQVLPSVDNIQLGPDPEDPNSGVVQETAQVYYTNEFPIFYLENGQKRRSSELSAGNKSILAMIGDLIIRLYQAQPRTINPQDFYGIVLIDELEIHLHPSWQRELPHLLSSLFPKIQFIVTTHSPIVFLGMPPETVIFNLQFDENGQTILQRLNLDLANILPNQILTSELFGMDNIRNIHNQGIEQLSLETEQERQQRLKLEEEIRQKAQNYQFTPPKKD